MEIRKSGDILENIPSTFKKFESNIERYYNGVIRSYNRMYAVLAQLRDLSVSLSGENLNLFGEAFVNRLDSNNLIYQALVRAKSGESLLFGNTDALIFLLRNTLRLNNFKIIQGAERGRLLDGMGFFDGQLRLLGSESIGTASVNISLGNSTIEGIRDLSNIDFLSLVTRVVESVRPAGVSFMFSLTRTAGVTEEKDTLF